MGRKGNDPQFLTVGHINKPHGTKGELFVWPLTDYPESVYAPGVLLRLGSEDAIEPDLSLPPLSVAGVRPFKRGYLVSFVGVADRDGAEALRGAYLFKAAQELEPLAEGEVFYHQLLGMSVVTVDGVEVGDIMEVYELRPAHMLEVRGDGREIMVPFLKDIVVQVDTADGRMVIDPPIGLLDL